MARTVSSCVRRRRLFECSSGRITRPARARGDTMALSPLAERLIAKSHRKCQAPEFRMEWKFASTSDAQEFEPFVIPAYNFKFPLAWPARSGRLRGVISACKPSENKLSGMNTCTKRVGGYPPIANGVFLSQRRSRMADCKSLGGGTRMGWVRQTVLADATCS
jgi:hypothetical protein